MGEPNAEFFENVSATLWVLGRDVRTKELIMPDEHFRTELHQKAQTWNALRGVAEVLYEELHSRLTQEERDQITARVVAVLMEKASTPREGK